MSDFVCKFPDIQCTHLRDFLDSVYRRESISAVNG